MHLFWKQYSYVQIYFINENIQLVPYTWYEDA